MGNILTCCVGSKTSRKPGRRKGPVEPDYESEICGAVAGAAVAQAPASQETEEFSMGTRHGHHLQHISDQERPRAQDQRKSNYFNHVFPGQLTRRYNSCSTIYVDDSTLSLPNCADMVECMTLAVYYHIKNRDTNRSLDILDERLHPLTREKLPEEYFEHAPEHKCIYRFVAFIFSAAWLPTECAILTLVYLERLVSYAEIDICPANWRRILLGAILLATKVWHDETVWNIDFCKVLGDVSLKDINELERHYLILLKYNVNVSGSVYAKYYFDLRSLAVENDIHYEFAPLTRERAQDLEAMSGLDEDKDLRRAAMRRSSSDGVFGIGLSKAVLS